MTHHIEPETITLLRGGHRCDLLDRMILVTRVAS